MSHLCQKCNSELVTEGLNSGQQIRCAQCLTIATFGQVGKVAADRLAWRSFWLGVSSILLLFFTGIPAIYYGIKSLLRMRFFKPKPIDRAAAIVGTTLGGCFGICVGLIVLTGLVVTGIVVATSTRTFEPTEVVELTGEFFEFTPPSGVEPVRAWSVLGSQHFFDYSDLPGKDERAIRVSLVHQGSALPVNKSQFIQQLDGRELNSSKKRKEVSHTILQWNMGNELIDVKKTVYTYQRTAAPKSQATSLDDSEQVLHYFGYVKRNRGFHAMVVMYQPARFEFSEEQVRELFASTVVESDVPPQSND